MGECRLEPTAGLVMRMALPLYSGGPAEKYISCLRLDGAESLVEQYGRVCPWYGEVILNRKYHIRAEALRAVGDGCHVVLPAAGQTPLGIELLSVSGGLVPAVFELDLSGMPEKERIVRREYPELSAKMHFLTQDISCPGWHEAVFGHPAWAAGTRTLVVFEGISYYLAETALFDSIAGFKTPDASAAVLLEYKVPDDAVSPERRHIPKGVFDVLKTSCGANVATYSEAYLRRRLGGLGAKNIRCADMRAMERARTGANKFFKTRADGWVECLSFNI